jgi:magnesium chelatase subunit D
MDEKFRRIALDATLKKAAFRIFQDNAFNIRKDDLMAKAYSGTGGSSILFVVDASGSMGVEELMTKTKSLVITLLKDAYHKRERVGMMVFRGIRADMVLPFTRSVHLAKSHLKEIKTGGKTPLSLALKKSITALATEKKKNNKNDIIILCFTDGRANISLTGNDPFEEALSYARSIRAMKVKAFIVDTDPTWISYPYAKDVAKEMDAKYFKLADIAEGNIRDLIYR